MFVWFSSDHPVTGWYGTGTLGHKSDDTKSLQIALKRPTAPGGAAGRTVSTARTANNGIVPRGVGHPPAIQRNALLGPLF